MMAFIAPFAATVLPIRNKKSSSGAPKKNPAI
jgi:hypothetical protein